MINARKFRCLGHYVFISYILGGKATSLSDSVGLNCLLKRWKYFFFKFGPEGSNIKSGQQDHKHSQILLLLMVFSEYETI
jgi:hypothetical protein